MTALAPIPAIQVRPTLTLPPAEAAALTAAYAAADVILEYGSGGSTVLAAEMSGKTVFSVESGADWAAGLQAWFDENPPASTVHLHAVDIGPTGDWGAPISQRGWRRYHHYPLSVWDRTDFLHPDVVLIDGRFRLACLLTVLHRITRPVVVLFDDYRDRNVYHRAETLVQPSSLIGRMARFDLVPRTMAPTDLAMFVDAFSRPA
jgi:hypothetical protein